MATIRKRTNSYHAQVRTKGFASVTKSFKLLSDAKRWANSIEADQAKGIFVDDTEAAKITLLSTLDRYEADQERLGRRSIRVLKSQLNLIRQSNLAPLTLNNVTPKAIIQFKQARMATGIKATTCIKDLKMLRAMFEYIQKEWSIALPKGNPVDLVSMPKHQDPTSRARRLEGDEEKRLLEELYKHSYETALIVRFALATGMRRGEILNVEFGHLENKKDVLRIPVTKTDNPRTIPISKETDSIIRERVNQICAGPFPNLPGHLFDTYPLFHLKPDSVSCAFYRACKTLGIQNLTFHDLRHEAISRLFEKGLDMMEVSAISGHKDLKMLQRYTHLKPESLLIKLNAEKPRVRVAAGI